MNASHTGISPHQEQDSSSYRNSRLEYIQYIFSVLEPTKNKKILKRPITGDCLTCRILMSFDIFFTLSYRITNYHSPIEAVQTLLPIKFYETFKSSIVLINCFYPFIYLLVLFIFGVPNKRNQIPGSKSMDEIIKHYCLSKLNSCFKSRSRSCSKD